MRRWPCNIATRATAAETPSRAVREYVQPLVARFARNVDEKPLCMFSLLAVSTNDHGEMRTFVITRRNADSGGDPYLSREMAQICAIPTRFGAAVAQICCFMAEGKMAGVVSTPS